MEASQLLEKTNKLLAERARINSELAKSLFSDLKEYINSLEGISAIEWTQYTPYFNDGDPCTFRLYVTGVHLDLNAPKLKEAMANSETLTSGLSSEAASKNIPDSVRLEEGWCNFDKHLLPSEILENIKKAKKLNETLRNCKDILEDELGDGYRVFLTKTKLYTEEYSHD